MKHIYKLPPYECINIYERMNRYCEMTQQGNLSYCLDTLCEYCLLNKETLTDADIIQINQWG